MNSKEPEEAQTEAVTGDRYFSNAKEISERLKLPAKPGCCVVFYAVWLERMLKYPNAADEVE